ncbi:flavin reductase family protein [Rhodococcus opacus]|uniref:flavin reductase family protein n=1 Tax=Rhodococcus opacus TaxID=37919 RepID=UPI001CEDCAD3|nr:flavin reductase family protein [Rhodococcus opacus]
MISEKVSTAVDFGALRRAMRRVPTSVVVAATMKRDTPVGMVVGTFTSVSADPPLVGFLGDHASRTVPALADAEYVSYCVLGETEGATVEAFRRPLGDRYRDLSWSIDADFGTPILTTAVVTIQTRRHSTLPAGDHTLILSEVLDVSTTGAGRPLVFYDGRLTRTDPTHRSASEFWEIGWVDGPT